MKTPHYNNLPQEIRNSKRFFAVSETKVPRQKGWSDPKNQLPLRAVSSPFAGFCCSPDYALLDFDHALNDNGDFLNEDAEYTYNLILKVCPNIFVERSISGHGLHIFLKPTDNFPMITNDSHGTLWFDREKDIKLEIFYKSQGRYCLVTGWLYNQDNNQIPSAAQSNEILHGLLDTIADISTSTSNITKEKVTAPVADEETILVPVSMEELQKLHGYKESNQQKQQSFNSDEYDMARANRMLELIGYGAGDKSRLPYPRWLAVISSCKALNIPYSTIDAFNRQCPERYNERQNLTIYESAQTAGYGIATLHGIAKDFGYEESEFRREYNNYPKPKPSRAGTQIPLFKKLPHKSPEAQRNLVQQNLMSFTRMLKPSLFNCGHVPFRFWKTPTSYEEVVDGIELQYHYEMKDNRVKYVFDTKQIRFRDSDTGKSIDPDYLIGAIRSYSRWVQGKYFDPFEPYKQSFTNPVFRFGYATAANTMHYELSEDFVSIFGRPNLQTVTTPTISQPARNAIIDKTPLDIYASYADGKFHHIHTAGEFYCKDRWCCPTCTPVYLNKQGALLNSQIDNAYTNGYEVIGVTFTIPHGYGRSLPNEAAVIHEALALFRRRAAYKKLDPVASVLAYEVTLSLHYKNYNQTLQTYPTDPTIEARFKERMVHYLQFYPQLAQYYNPADKAQIMAALDNVNYHLHCHANFFCKKDSLSLWKDSSRRLKAIWAECAIKAYKRILNIDISSKKKQILRSGLSISSQLIHSSDYLIKNGKHGLSGSEHINPKRKRRSRGHLDPFDLLDKPTPFHMIVWNDFVASTFKLVRISRSRTLNRLFPAQAPVQKQTLQYLGTVTMAVRRDMIQKDLIAILNETLSDKPESEAVSLAQDFFDCYGIDYTYAPSTAEHRRRKQAA